jgi:hypothetical protein
MAMICSLKLRVLLHSSIFSVLKGLGIRPGHSKVQWHGKVNHCTGKQAICKQISSVAMVRSLLVHNVAPGEVPIT